MNGVEIEVGLGNVEIASSPDILVTRGLGSCVGITLYAPNKKIGGLAHAMLPSYTNAKIKSNPARFVDTAISLMIEKLVEKGCKVRDLEAKLVGGARMFSFISKNSFLNIGDRNVRAAKERLNSYGIKIVGEDTGSNYGRTVYFELATGKVKVKTLFSGEKEL